MMCSTITRHLWRSLCQFPPCLIHSITITQHIVSAYLVGGAREARLALVVHFFSLPGGGGARSATYPGSTFLQPTWWATAVLPDRNRNTSLLLSCSSWDGRSTGGYRGGRFGAGGASAPGRVGADPRPGASVPGRVCAEPGSQDGRAGGAGALND